MRRQKLKELWKKLKKETLSRKSPHEIALGIGLGSFLGVFPIQGFKTALVVLIGSLYKKVNLIAVFVASSIPSFPVAVPFVYFFDYWVGTKLLKIPVVFTLSFFKHFNMKMLGSSLWALFLGGAVVGIVLGMVTYFLSFFIIRLRRKPQVLARK
jgi:uncharacterized protein (DUF2062 family)